MNPLSNDLRKRILDAVDNHEGPRRQLARRFGVNTSTITRLLQLRRQTGSSEPRPHGGGTAPTLDQDDLDRLRRLVEDDPDATLEAVTFQGYVEEVLVPALREGDVVVFDNLSSHLGRGVSEAIEAAGASVLRLPPYSPEYTPIEEMFSKFKAFLRGVGARAKDHLYDAIGEGLREVSIRDILGWFQHAGLCATRT
jgi:transposase